MGVTETQRARESWGNADIDFAASALSSAITDIFINNGDGTFSDESNQRLPAFITNEQPGSGLLPASAGTVAFIDADGDGDSDLITAPYSNSFPQFNEAIYFHILLNDGSGNFKNEAIRLDARPGGLADFYGYQSIHVADFDGNGLEDFIAVAEVNTGVANVDPNTGTFLTYYSQTSPGVFADVTTQSFANYFIPATNHSNDLLQNHALSELYLGDLDGDGDIDVMRPYFNGRPEDISSSLFLNTNGTFSPVVENASFAAAEQSVLNSFSQPEAGSVRLLMGDVNNDDVADIVALSSVFNAVVPTSANPFGLNVTIDAIVSGGVQTGGGSTGIPSAASLAIANQMALTFLGRGIDSMLNTNTANLLNSGQPSKTLLDTWFQYGISDGVFSATDSLATVVNKVFNNIFGRDALPFEQAAWSGLTLGPGGLSTGELIWGIWSGYLGATNVPDTYKIPAQTRLIVTEAYTNALADNPLINSAIATLGSTTVVAARDYLSGVIDIATAAPKAAAAMFAVNALTSSLSAAMTSNETIESSSGSFALAYSAEVASNTVFDDVESTQLIGTRGTHQELGVFELV